MNRELEDDDKLVVLAMGGNALHQQGQQGTYQEQFANARAAVEPIVQLLKKGYRFVLTHGNGPPVGAVMLMVDKAKNEVPETPLGIADAMTCGSIGYMIAQSLQNTMIKHNMWKNVVNLPTQIIVDPNDYSFFNPTKPIGKFYSKEEAETLTDEKKWILREDAGRGWRRYVASPYPIDIIEKEAMKTLISHDYLVITGGGGGIPVSHAKDGTINGVDCVIDKDLASMKIALSIGASTLVIVTGVRKVAINFGKKEQQDFSTMTLTQVRYHIQAGEFPAGSMKPKMQAAVEFIQANPKNRVIITDIDHLSDALEGKDGTHIVAY